MNKEMSDHNHYEFSTLPNGLRLLVVPMDDAKTVTVLVLVATGSRYEPEEANGISHFLEHLMFKGTKKRPGILDISCELDSIGADYNAFTSKEYTGYYVKCTAEKLDQALDVISDIFQNSRFDQKEIDRERGPIKEEINMYFDHPPRHVAEIYDKLIYGNHPLGWDIAGRKEVIDRLSRDDFVKYFSGHYFAQNTVVAVAGKCDAEDIGQKIQKYFNAVREGGAVKPVSFSGTQAEPAMTVENRKTDQTHICVGFRAYSRFHPKHEALQLLSIILGGGMSSRLFTEVRVNRGLAYRVVSSTTAFDEIGDFTTSAGLNNENLYKALDVILKEYKKLVLEPVSERELNRVKDQARGSFVINLETSDALASFYGEQELLEKKIETPEQRMEKIMAVTPQDMLEVAQDIIKPENLNLAVIGPFKEDDAEINNILKSW